MVVVRASTATAVRLAGSINLTNTNVVIERYLLVACGLFDLCLVELRLLRGWSMACPAPKIARASGAQRSFANCVGKSIGMGRCTLRRSDFLSNLSLVVSATATIHSPQSSFLHKQTENAPTQIVLGACRIVAMKTQRVTHIRICHASRIGFRQLEYGVLQQGETKLRFFRAPSGTTIGGRLRA